MYVYMYVWHTLIIYMYTYLGPAQSHGENTVHYLHDG